MDKIATSDHTPARAVRPPRGPERTCRGWGQEAALRMLMNSLDPEIAENPQDLVVCGGSMRAATDWASFDAIARALGELGNNQTLLVEAGRPAGIFPSGEHAPRVLLTGDGAGSWTYIGPQGILLETYVTFAAAGKKHFGGDLAGKLVVSSGMGQMGGVAPLAATMNGAAVLCVEADPEQIKKWMKWGSGEVMVNSLDEALRILKNAVRKREPASVGLVGNCAEVIPELASRGVVPDLLTDRTGAHDPLNGYLPSGLAPDEATALRLRDPQEYRKRAMESIARQVEGMLALARLGSAVFDFGNGIRAMAREAGVRNARDFPDAAAYIQPLLDAGQGPLRCVALSGEPADIRRIDRLAPDIFGMFGEDETSSRWIRLAGSQVRFEGLPARACWLGRAERARLGVAINDMVARAELEAPVVIAGGDFIAARGAQPSRETEATPAGTAAKADGKLVNSLIEAASGASWAWFQSGGEADQWRRSGYAVVADGTKETAARIERLLTEPRPDIDPS